MPEPLCEDEGPTRLQAVMKKVEEPLILRGRALSLVKRLGPVFGKFCRSYPDYSSDPADTRAARLQGHPG